MSVFKTLFEFAAVCVKIALVLVNMMQLLPSFPSPHVHVFDVVHTWYLCTLHSVRHRKKVLQGKLV